LSSSTAVTNAAGVASVTATANGIPGSYTVIASYNVTGSLAPLSATFALTNQASSNSDLARGKLTSQSSTFPGYPSASASTVRSRRRIWKPTPGGRSTWGPRCPSVPLSSGTARTAAARG
jgi:hypothetical protein